MDVKPFETTKLFDVNYEHIEDCTLSINQGGTSSGKTYALVQMLFIKAIEDPKSVTTIVGQDIPNLKRGAIRDAKNIVSSSEFIQHHIDSYLVQDKTYKFRNGSIIEFTSYDNEQDAKNGKRDRLFCNEVNGISEDIFDALYIRTSGHTWVDFNPTAFFWLLTDKWIKADFSRVIISTYRHNPFIEAKTLKDIERYKTTNPFKWKVYGLGQLGVLEGGIIKAEWLQTITWDAFKTKVGRSTPIWNFKLDTAYTAKTENDPTGYLASCFINNCLYIRRSASKYLEFPELCEWIEEQVTKDGYTNRSSIQVEAKASGLSVIQALKRSSKLNIKAFKYPKVEGKRMDDKDKVSRVHAITEILSSQRVYLIQDNWNSSFINQCTEFPNSAHDDEVDCLVMEVMDNFFNVASDEFDPE